MFQFQEKRLLKSHQFFSAVFIFKLSLEYPTTFSVTIYGTVTERAHVSSIPEPAHGGH